MYKYIIIPILLLLIGFTNVQAVERALVTFINQNPGVTQLGLVKFVIDENGKKVDYKLMNMRWDYKLYVIDLEPGVYGATQYMAKYNKIVGYQTFTVGNEPMIVKFQKLHIVVMYDGFNIMVRSGKF